MDIPAAPHVRVLAIRSLYEAWNCQIIPYPSHLTHSQFEKGMKREFMSFFFTFVVERLYQTPTRVM